MLVHDPVCHRRAISPAGTGQIEDEIGPFVESVLASDGLDIVAIQNAPAEAAIQLAQ